MTDRKVSAELEVTKTGDTEAFAEAAQEVEALAAAATEAADPLVGFFERLETAVKGAAEALESGDLAGQEQAFRDIAGTLADLRPQLDSAFKEGAITAEQYEEALRTVEQAQLALRSSTREIAAAVTAASEAMAELEESTSSGFAGAADKAARARAALDAYRRAVDQASDAGEDLGEAEIQQLAELERRYDAAIDSVGRYTAAKRQAARDIEASAAATEGEVKNIRSLQDLITKAVPQWGRYVGAAGAVIGVFTAAYEAGSKLRDVLNEITDGGFDRWVQQSALVVGATEALVGGLDRTTISAQNTARQMEILWRHGINPTGKSAEEVAAMIVALGAAITQGSRDADKATKDHEKYAKSIGLSEKELKKAADALATFINRFRQEQDGPLPQETVEAFEKRIRTILDGYVLLGSQAPAEIRKLADEWGVLTTAEETAVAKHKALVAEYLESITGITAGSVEQLKAEADALVQAVESIDFDQAKGLRTDAFRRIQEEVRALVEEFKAAGVLVPEDLAKIADQAGILVTAWQRVGTFAFEAGERAGQGTVKIVESLDAAGNKVKQVVQDFDALGTAGEAAGERAAQGTVKVIDTVDEAGNKVKQVVQVFAEAGAAGEAAGEKAAAGTLKWVDTVDEAGNKVKQLVQDLDQGGGAAATFFDKITVSAKDGAQAVSDAAKATEEGAAAADKAAGAIAGAAASTAQLADAGASAEGQMADLEERLKKVNEQVVGQEERLGSLETRLTGIAGAWPNAFGGAHTEISAVNSALDTTIGKLAMVQQKLAEIQAAGPASAPGEAVN